MGKQYEKEYRKYMLSVQLWLEKIKRDMKLLPKIKKVSNLTYDEWYELYKDKLENKKELPAVPEIPKELDNIPDNSEN
jgi:hypothetical protein